MKALLLLLSLFASSAFAGEASVCSTYLRLEDQLRCPSGGYLSQGYELCQSYVAIDAQFSLAGRRSMAIIRRCLTSSLAAHKGLTCENVEDVAFGTHVGCYVRGGFCTLPLADKALVFRVAARMLFNGKAWKQFPRIEAACKGR